MTPRTASSAKFTFYTSSPPQLGAKLDFLPVSPWSAGIQGAPKQKLTVPPIFIFLSIPHGGQEKGLGDVSHPQGHESSKTEPRPGYGAYVLDLHGAPEWFSFQKEKVDRAPSTPAPDAVLFTCPSCRASVRDTKHNATVVTLLDMYTAAKPNKARTADDKEEMNKKYQRGDQVIPHVATRERTADERRAEEDDRRLLDEVREISLRESDGGGPFIPPRQRHGSRASEERISSRRARDDGRPRRTTNQLGMLSDGHRVQRSESQQRRIGHQSSLRSLISSGDMSERDIEREIEEFARQIQEEGLLDGLDLDNIDLTRDDELSRRVTEAYRRRQRDRVTSQPTRRDSPATRNEANSGARDGEIRLDPRPRPLEVSNPSRSREGSSSRPATSSSSTEERDRRPPTSLESQTQTRARRRTASGSRAATLPIVPTETLVRPAVRSQTDLTLPNERAASSSLRPNTSDAKSSNGPSAPAELPGSAAMIGSSFASRLARPPTTNANESPRTSTDSPRASSASRPNRADLAIIHSAATTPTVTSPVQSGHQRNMSQLYPEPSITCMRCNKTHIEYEIHYNCSICAGGHWSMCIDCYRSGKGCQYWFGFGHGGWNKWRRRRQQRSDESLAPPHILTPSRYQPPPSTPGGADGRKTLTMDDPRLRLETGMFCAKCQVWTNYCYWRCDICNDGEWGYCNNCVNQGRTCSHPLLPLSHEIPEPHSRSPGRPTAAKIATESQNRSISPFQPLSFATTCDICRITITPSDIRYHCYSCTSSLVENAAPGDYDICSPCYADLVNKSKISAENGHSGWRRCLKGHRMVVIGFAPGEVGQWRYIERDLVGGRKLRIEPLGDDSQADPPSQKWSWKQDDQKLERLVTQEVSATAPTSHDSVTYQTLFPPDGGVGKRVFAKWAWFPKEEADDELLFPRGAEIREAEDVNGDWYYGVYMGAKGLFPSGYVRVDGDAS
ncbi:RING finger domain-containing protein [Cordyceps militaris CM01]|uniref:RING finger domain-containing protein n=1 Tax=Cordyceps militaris (strain CM01) TaxID=983644 RepID=G3J5A7_CORMM|nr:RING finger domain-containing protein [Cordyceps militaris CM01]EGX96817.1 RING finger domain-containing protein [Cordyceps militaris CM01]